ncbi:hypothetical protein GCM10010304_81750 [Streptomyces roseoviolaceus]
MVWATTKRIRAGKWRGSGVQGPAKAPGTTLLSHTFEDSWWSSLMTGCAVWGCDPRLSTCLYQQESSAPAAPDRRLNSSAAPYTGSPCAYRRDRAPTTSRAAIEGTTGLLERLKAARNAQVRQYDAQGGSHGAPGKAMGVTRATAQSRRKLILSACF